MKKSSAYAIGMKSAERTTGDRPPLRKSTIVRGHEIAKKILAREAATATKQSIEKEIDAVAQKKRYAKNSQEASALDAKKRSLRDSMRRVREEREPTPLSEVLSIAGRVRRGMETRRDKMKLLVARERQAKKSATKDRLKGRAIRSARALLAKRLTKGISKAELTPQMKAEVERKLGKMRGRIVKIANKLLPQVRERDLARLKSARTGSK